MRTEATWLISMPEIAELAGVQRPVVTMWRRRHNGSFPRPIGGDASRLLFDAREILDWLVDTGRADRETIEPDLRQHALSHFGSQMKPKDLIALATALVCLRSLDEEPLQPGGGHTRTLAERARRIDPSDMLLRSEIEAIGDHDAWLVAAVDELVEAAWGGRPAFERLLASRTRLHVPTLYRDAVAPELAKLVAAVSGASDYATVGGVVTVVDPWAGTGDLLTAVVAAVGEHGQLTISAAVNDDYRSRLLRRRLSIWDLPGADVRVHTAAALPAGVQWDVLVTSLPYGAQENRSRERQLGFLRQLATNLGQQQSAVVLGPADLLTEQLPPAAVGIRNDILRTDAVEAVITLPGGLMPFRPGYQTALWVLRRDESGRGQGRVLLADVSDRSLTADVAEDLVQDVTTWRREGFHPAAHRRAFATPVRIADLLEEHGSLSRQREPDLPEAGTLQHSRVARLLDLQTQMTEQDRHPRPTPIRADVAARDADARTVVTVGALIRQEHVKRLKGAHIATEDITGAGHHRIIGTAELAGQLRPGQRMVDRLVLAERYPRVHLTEPGDVIVAMAPNLATYVDIDGFCIAEYPAVVLRVNGEGRTLTPRTLAALISAASARRPPGAVRTRRLDQLPIPTLEPNEVEALDELLANLDERRRRAQDEIDTLDTLRQTAVTGVADGTLTITSNL
jgi:predicted DNA-binding transcriptional regulator AlpA